MFHRQQPVFDVFDLLSLHAETCATFQSSSASAAADVIDGARLRLDSDRCATSRLIASRLRSNTDAREALPAPATRT
jgi:hypothetical protein